MWLPLWFWKHSQWKGYPLCSFWRFPHPRTPSPCQECAWLEPASSGNIPFFLLEPHSHPGSHPEPMLHPKLENLPTPPSLPSEPTPSQFNKFGLLAQNWVFWTLKKTCSVSPDGISRVEGNRLVFVTLSPVEDYGQSSKLGVGQWQEVWSGQLT